jgi:Hg(II)-responsive transcriptional regulator
MSETSTLTIGALAQAAGIGVETVRFYERRGLLPEPPRTPSGYRQYPGEAVDRVKFIRRAQGLGFALREISELLDLRVDEVAACGPVEVQAREKLEQVAGKIKELQRMEAALQRLVEACQAREPTGACPILEELDQAGSPDR